MRCSNGWVKPSLRPLCKPLIPPQEQSHLAMKELQQSLRMAEDEAGRGWRQGVPGFNFPLIGRGLKMNVCRIFCFFWASWKQGWFGETDIDETQSKPRLPIFSFKEDMNLVIYNLYTLIYTLYIYTYRHTYTDIHIQTYIYRHTYRHTYMHTHTNIWTSIPKITTCPHLCRKQKNTRSLSRGEPLQGGVGGGAKQQLPGGIWVTHVCSLLGVIIYCHIYLSNLI